MKALSYASVATLAATAALSATAAQAQTYFRVDTGYSWSRDAKIHDQNFPRDGLICGDALCINPGFIDDVGNSAIFGLGIGRRYSPNFRADVTAAYRGGYEIDQAMPNSTHLSANVKSWNLMLNGYYDFPLTWGRPFVGAGMGYARNKVSEITATNALFPGTAVIAPGGTSSGFAWALMAGISFPLGGGGTMLEVGYRYVDLNRLETDSGPVATVPTVLGLTYSGATGKLLAHEVTVGVRF